MPLSVLDLVDHQGLGGLGKAGTQLDLTVHGEGDPPTFRASSFGNDQPNLPHPRKLGNEGVRQAAGTTASDPSDHGGLRPGFPVFDVQDAVGSFETAHLAAETGRVERGSGGRRPLTFWVAPHVGHGRRRTAWRLEAYPSVRSTAKVI